MKEIRKTNCLKVLNYLKNHRYITVKKARKAINVDFCTQRIYDLKNYFGVDIKSTLVTTRDNERFSIYTLEHKS
jgi:hypothetical protein